MELREILARNLRTLMRDHPDLDTQVKIRERSKEYTPDEKGLSQSTIQRILACEVHTGLDVLQVLSKVFGTSPSWLITDQRKAKKIIDTGFPMAERSVQAQTLAAQFDMVPPELNRVALQHKLERAIVEWLTGTQPTPAPILPGAAKKRSSKIRA